MRFKKFVDPFHPGEVLLEEFLEPHGWSQRAFAQRIGWTHRKVNEIIRGKRGISVMAAIELAETLGTTPEFWMNLQQMWDLAAAYELRRAG